MIASKQLDWLVAAAALPPDARGAESADRGGLCVSPVWASSGCSPAPRKVGPWISPAADLAVMLWAWRSQTVPLSRTSRLAWCSCCCCTLLPLLLAPDRRTSSVLCSLHRPV